MNHPVDVHPEDLLDRERDGALTLEDRRRLDAHAAWCSACALVRRAGTDFAVERITWRDDEALAQSLANRVLGATRSVTPPGVPARSRAPQSAFIARSRRRRRSWTVAAVVMFAATGATASLWSVRRFLVAHPVVSPPPSLAATAEPRKAPAAKPAEIAAVTVGPETAPQAPKAVHARAANAATTRPKAAEEPVVAPPADQLFAAANEARRRGDSSQAIKLYGQLQQQHAGTREETTSRVLLGRLLLDRGEDAAQALTLFTRYLDTNPNGTLAEEAHLGRAVALMRLGRAQEERQAWQQLLSFHPHS